MKDASVCLSDTIHKTGTREPSTHVLHVCESKAESEDACWAAPDEWSCVFVTFLVYFNLPAVVSSLTERSVLSQAWKHVTNLLSVTEEVFHSGWVVWLYGFVVWFELHESLDSDLKYLFQTAAIDLFYVGLSVKVLFYSLGQNQPHFDLWRGKFADIFDRNPVLFSVLKMLEKVWSVISLSILNWAGCCSLVSTVLWNYENVLSPN